MEKIKIKPLSVNKAWKGRRYKTQEYKNYVIELTNLLPDGIIPEGKLSLYYDFGFSSKGSDIDNCVKTTTDILSKKYGFNDNLIYTMFVKKTIVKKGQEFIKFGIFEYNY